MNTRLIPAILLFVAAGAGAQEESEGPWSGKTSLGYLATSGNTDNSNLNSGFEITYAPDSWNHTLALSAINATEDEATTAEAYEAGWKSELMLSEANYLFGRLRWRKDRFSSYDTQFSQTVGYGRRLIDSERHKLNAEAGVGARQSDLTDGTSEDEIILRGGLDYTWTLSDTAEFTQVLAVESGDSNTYIETVTALKATLIGKLAMVASYQIKHNTDVVPGTEKTDTYTSLALEYGF